jgi:mono/diheme cytochrome c family protein
VVDFEPTRQIASHAAAGLVFYTDDMGNAVRRSWCALLLTLPACAVIWLLTPQATVAQRRGGNPQAALIENPVAATPESLAAGKRTYTRLCESCHGPSGHGDGTEAGADQPSDLGDGVWDFGSSDGEIFTVIRDGVSGKDMRPFAERLSDADIWNVVNFLRTLGPQ